MPPSPSPLGDVGGGQQGFSKNNGPDVAGAAALGADVPPSGAAAAVAAPAAVAGNSIPKDIVAVRRNGRHVCYST